MKANFLGHDSPLLQTVCGLDRNYTALNLQDSAQMEVSGETELKNEWAQKQMHYRTAHFWQQRS